MQSRARHKRGAARLHRKHLSAKTECTMRGRLQPCRDWRLGSHLNSGGFLGQFSTLFFDIGGVILTNGWDQIARRHAAETFDLDWDNFEDRHQMSVDAFETGRIGIDAYIAAVVFNEPRGFAADDFKAHMFAQSVEMPESRKFVDQFAGMPEYFVATINNEGREINEYRIAKFDLTRTFSMFFSSCYVGLRKPAPAIFRLALDVSQRRAAETIFVDDREENLDGARQLGITTIQFKNVAQLESDFRTLGIHFQKEIQTRGTA
jgi:putative hydrolase of the HAD superfamily